MPSLFLALLLGSFVTVATAQSTNPPSAPPASAQAPDSSASRAARTPSLEPPHSDRVNADSLPEGSGESSSKDTQIDLSPPSDDAKAHPKSSEVVRDAETAPGTDVGEFHPWDPHKAAKDVEVGDFYFKRKNYRAAEDRYREALYYKDNDAIATFRLAVCLEKMDRSDEARAQYESYLKILPHGPQSDDAHKAIEHIKAADSRANVAK